MTKPAGMSYSSKAYKPGGFCCLVEVGCPDHGGQGYAFFATPGKFFDFLKDEIERELSIASDVKLDSEEGLAKGAKEYLGESGEEPEGDEIQVVLSPLLQLYRLILGRTSAAVELKEVSQIIDWFNEFFSERGEEIHLTLMSLKEVLDEIDIDEDDEELSGLQELLDDDEFDENKPEHLKLARKAIPRPTWE